MKITKKQKLISIFVLALFGMGNASASTIFGDDGTNATFSITENIDFTATGASDPITRFIFEDAYSVAQSAQNSGAISNTTATMVVNDGTAIPDVTNVAAVPAAAWLFASGLIGVVGVSRRSPRAAALSA